MTTILYSFRRCPYAMRARLALYYAGIEHEHREVVLKDKPAHMLEISPKGTVPVLIVSDGQVIEESIDIMRYALAQNDPDGWLNDADCTRDLIEYNDHEFKRQLDRSKYPNRYPDEDTRHAKQQAMIFIDRLNDCLANKSFLSGEKIGITDMAIFPFIRQFANIDYAWFETQSVNSLRVWLNKNLESDLFKAIMTKYTQWNVNDDPIIKTF